MSDPAPRPVPLRIVNGATAAWFGVTIDELSSDSRSRSIVTPRHIAMWLGRRQGHSFGQVGRALGRRDHTTVINAVMRVNRMIEAGSMIPAEIERSIIARNARRVVGW